MSRPILFLDIDGVLNRHKQHPRTRYCRTDEDLVLLLDKILVQTNCEIVLTSAWRYLVHGGSMTMEGLRNLLHSHWIDGERLVDITRRDITDGTPLEKTEPRSDRGEQVAEWLMLHPEVQHCCILDDIDLGYTEAKLDPWFILVDDIEGLHIADVNSAVHLLTKGPAR